MKLQYTKVLLMASLSAFVGLIFPVFQVKALTISPIRIELAADPGQEVSGTFKLFNEQTTDQTFYIKFVNFETKDETGEPAYVPGTDGLPSWVSAPDSVRARAKEYTDVEFTIAVPDSADPGGYFAGIFASRTAPGFSDEGDVAIQTEVGSLIFLRVNGEFKEGETILEFNTKEKEHLFDSLPISFYYRFQNSGEDRIKPLGDITVENMFGRTSKVINANKGVGSVLPKSIRKFEATWASSGGGVEAEQGNAEVRPEQQSYVEKLRWQWEHFAFGRYTAQLHLTVNNDSSRSYSEAINFWVIPWELTLTVVLGLVLVGGLILAIALVIAWIIVKKKKD